MKDKHSKIWFAIEIVIPLLASFVLPLVMPDCNMAEAFISGTCVSIILEIWSFSKKTDEHQCENEVHHRDTLNNFENVNERMSYLETFLTFERDISNISSPYFQMRINRELNKCLQEFRRKNRELIEGYTETNPYSIDTYGVRGLKWTKNELLAVSAISDYWDRSDFVSDYLEEQFRLIDEQSITIRRIFVGTQAHLKSIEPQMKIQKAHGIDVYCMETDTPFFNHTWLGQDFLIQDRKLVVDIIGQTHTAEAEDVKEIITVDEILVGEKIELFNQMLTNAKAYNE